MKTSAIPRFFLYGEPPEHVGPRFLHLEPLDERSRPANWNIRPHTHGDLNHVFFIKTGRGAMSADGMSIKFEAPCLLIVPAGLVHGFDFADETNGSVLTVSEGYFQDLVQRCVELRTVFLRAAALPCRDVVAVSGALNRLGQELAWTAPGHALSVEAMLSTVLVEALRSTRDNNGATAHEGGPRRALVARFRAQLEATYRDKTSVSAFASALGVTAKQLRTACLAIADAPPSRLIQDRIILEAKRLLLYSNMTVSEAAFYLGFEDSAYFTRVFTRSCGASPREFRSRALASNETRSRSGAV